MAKSETPKPGLKLGLFGMDKLNFLDIPHDKLLKLAEEIGAPQHELAVELWNNGSYEAKLLSCMFCEPSKVTKDQADTLARGVNSWIICEYCCSKLLWKLPFAMKKSLEWADSGDDTLSCVGFSLMAALAANLPPSAANELGFFDNALFYARKHASDANLDVRRAITSALHQIGKRNRDWHEAAIETAEEIGAQPCEAARWVATQSLGELKSTKFKNHLKGE
ncbi:MAG: DNA alkylation repair protein [Synergistaceae bacterium]|nr:DNA alkylation repair protein [Synergistaceae bacterium]